MSAVVIRGLIALLFMVPFTLQLQAQTSGTTAAQRGFLGVQVGPTEQGEKGIMVVDVTADTPASRSGLKRGDRIVKVDNDQVQDSQKFLQSIAAKKPGDKIALGVLRDGKDETLNVTLGEWPAPDAIAGPNPFRRPAFLGVQTEAMNPDLKKRLNVNADSGTVITDVIPDSPAARAGLRRDDVITALNDKPLRSPMELHQAVVNAGAGKEVQIQLTRGMEKMTAKVTLREVPFGFIPVRGDERFPMMADPMMDPVRRIRELERRVDELENKIKEMQKK